MISWIFAGFALIEPLGDQKNSSGYAGDFHLFLRNATVRGPRIHRRSRLEFLISPRVSCKTLLNDF